MLNFYFYSPCRPRHLCQYCWVTLGGTCPIWTPIWSTEGGGALGGPWPSTHMCTVSKMEVGLHPWEAHPTGKGCHSNPASNSPGSPPSKSSPNAHVENPRVKGGACGLLQVGIHFPQAVSSPWDRHVETLGSGEWQGMGPEAKGNTCSFKEFLHNSSNRNMRTGLWLSVGLKTMYFQTQPIRWGSPESEDSSHVSQGPISLPP